MRKPDQYAVMGNPIGHSKSPLIHSLFAAQTEQHLEYSAILAPLGDFATAADAFRDAGGKGFNVTVPFKQDAWVYVDELSPRAERAKAVNTIQFRDSGALGENTDGLGLVCDLTVNYEIDIKDKRILLLGAGGAARGVLQPLLAEQPALLVIANRTPEKAAELGLLFNEPGQSIMGCGFTDLGGRSFDLIINATSAGLEGSAPPLPDDILAPDGCCYDMFYADEPTPFMRWAQAHNAAQTLDGIGMLVEQAAESFLLWRGIRPDTEPVIAKLRAR